MPSALYLFEPYDETKPGFVSPYCRFEDDGEQRLIFINERLVYCYDQRDKLATRQVWVSLYENGFATYGQIADATDIGERTLQLWVSRFRTEGAKGLVDRPRSGAPKKVTKKVRRRISRLRRQRLSVFVIAQRCAISVSSVEKVLTARKKAADAQQEQFEIVSEGDESLNVNRVEAESENRDREDSELAEVCPQTAERSDTAMAVVHDRSSDNTDSAGEIETADEEHLKTEEERAISDVLPSTAPEPVSSEVVVEEHPEAVENRGFVEMDDATEAFLAMNRSDDRIMAGLGLLQDAPPLFAPAEKLEWAGAFLAIALLATDPFLRLAKKLYGDFHAAFYGVRTTMLTLVVMALLRVKRPEDLRQHNSEKLGRVLGLDRIHEVKTMRRKLHQFETVGVATVLMDELAKARVQEYQGEIRAVLVDGHVAVYSGKVKIGQVYASRCNRVGKGQTDNWVNLPGRCPLFTVSSGCNEGLSRVLPDVLAKAREITSEHTLTCAFDRGGYNVLLFERLIHDGYHIITYRRGGYDPMPDSCFQRKPTRINGRTYEFAPYEHDVELKVYEPVDRGSGKKPGYRDTKRRLKLREIRVRRPDGRQTAILTSHLHGPSAVEIASVLFDRIGSQENIFKYLRTEFALDALYTYGEEELPAELDHPNPAYVKLEKQAKKLRAKRAALLAEYGEELADADDETIIKRLHELRQSETCKALMVLNKSLAELREKMAQTPARESLTEAGYKQLKSEVKQLMNTIKLTAYHMETRLVDMVRPAYTNTTKEGRRMIASALRSTGSLKLTPGRLVIQLEPQSEPRRTRAINELAAQLNALEAKFPGSQRTIVFEPTPVPDSPKSSKQIPSPVLDGYCPKKPQRK